MRAKSGVMESWSIGALQTGHPCAIAPPIAPLLHHSITPFWEGPC